MSTDTPELPKLTTKQQRFIEAYCGAARFNASEAARMAGYSEKSAAKQGHDLKKTPYIRARIDDLLHANTVSGAEVLHELTDVAMRGLGEFVEVIRWDDDDNPIAAKMDANAKMKALEMLGKAHGLFTENVSVSGSLRREIVIVDGDDE